MYATLNDTVAARDFAKRLPCNFTGRDSGTEYCCVTARGIYDPLETQTGWKNGDLSLGDGWFSIHYGGEEQSSEHYGVMVIGRLEEESRAMIESLPCRVRFHVAFA